MILSLALVESLLLCCLVETLILVFPPGQIVASLLNLLFGCSDFAQPPTRHPVDPEEI